MIYVVIILEYIMQSSHFGADRTEPNPKLETMRFRLLGSDQRTGEPNPEGERHHRHDAGRNETHAGQSRGSVETDGSH